MAANIFRYSSEISTNYLLTEVRPYTVLSIDNKILNFLDIVLRAIATDKNVTNFTERKNGGHLERQAAIGRRNVPHYSYIAVHTRK